MFYFGVVWMAMSGGKTKISEEDFQKFSDFWDFGLFYSEKSK